MGFFSNLIGKKEANHNGLLNKIANPNPNGGNGLFDKVGRINNGQGLIGGLFNRNKTPNTTQTTNFTDNNDKGGSSW